MRDPVEDLCATLICCGHHLQSNADIALVHYRKVKDHLARAERSGRELVRLEEWLTNNYEGVTLPDNTVDAMITVVERIQTQLNKEAVCSWEYCEDYECWDTSCGETMIITDGLPSENFMKYCWSCGRKLVEYVPVMEDEE